VWALVQRGAQPQADAQAETAEYEQLELEGPSPTARVRSFRNQEPAIHVQSALDDVIASVTADGTGTIFVLTGAVAEQTSCAHLAVTAYGSDWDLLWQTDISSAAVVDGSCLILAEDRLLVVTQGTAGSTITVGSLGLEDGGLERIVELEAESVQVAGAQLMPNGTTVIGGFFSGLLTTDSGTEIGLAAANGSSFLLTLSPEGGVQLLANPDVERLRIQALAVLPSDGSLVVVGQRNERPGELSIVRMFAEGRSQWVRSLESTEFVSIHDIAEGSDGSVVLAGAFCGLLNVDGLESVVGSAAGADGLLLALDARGQYRWVNTVRGSGDDTVTTVTLRTPQLLVAGGFFSGCVDLDHSLDATLRCSVGASDGILFTVLAESGEMDAVQFYSGPGDDRVSVVRALADSSLMVAGEFSATVDIDSSVRSRVLRSAGGLDSWLTRTTNHESSAIAANN